MLEFWFYVAVFSMPEPYNLTKQCGFVLAKKLVMLPGWEGYSGESNGFCCCGLWLLSSMG